MALLGFGGGCHWCTEAVFQSLRDLRSVSQGFIRSDPPHDAFSEAVEVEFDPAEITLEALVRVHLATHSSTSDHQMRGKYRSAIYAPTEDLAIQARSALEHVTRETGLRFVTHILPHKGFKSSDERYQNYHAKNTERPFCQTYINPKLAKLRKDFLPLLKPAEEVR